jgi:hypothetical protein
MDPEAEELYERLDVEPTTPHSELQKKISLFVARYSGEREAISEIQRHLNDKESRREYNRRNCYPVDWEDVDEVIELTVTGPDVVEVSEPVTIAVVDDDDHPVEDAAVTVSGTDLGATDSRGRCSFAFDETGTTTVEVNKDGDGDVRYRGATSDIEVTKERRELRIRADSSKISVDKSVTFTVTDDSDDPVKGAVVKLPTGQQNTDSSGECTHTFRTADTFEIEAAKKDDGDITYVSTSTSVRVEPKTVTLSVSADATDAVVGEPVTITVNDSGTDTPVEGATLAWGSSTTTTDSNGRATVEFASAGTNTIEATKPDDRDRTYRSDSVTIDVDREERSLSVDLHDSTATAERPITISVTDDTGTPIENATVSGGDESAMTDSRGSCTLTFASAGTVTITATKSKTPAATFTEAKIELTIEKRSERLTVEAESTKVEAHEPVEIRVSDSSGNRVGDAIVDFPKGNEHTDDRGKCTLRFSTVGSAKLTARKPDTDSVAYASDETSVTVRPREVDLNVSTNVDTIKAGDPVFITVRDTDGDRIENVDINAGSSHARTDDRGRCTVSPDSEGTIQVRAEKEDEPTIKFNSDSTSLDVSLEERDLHIEAPGEAPAGSTTSVTVRDDEGEQIENAVVSSPAGEVPTDARGTCEIPLPDANVANVTAHKSVADGIRYNRDTVQIDLSGATSDPATDHSSNEMSKAMLAVLFVIIAMIPVVGVLFVFDFGIGLPLIFGAVLAISFVLIFALMATR